MVINQVLVLFFLIVIGAVVRKLNVVTEDIDRQLSNLVVKVTLPAFLFSAMMFDFSPDMLYKSLNLIGISFCMYTLSITLSYTYVKFFKVDGTKADVYQYIITFSNVGFMGYPVMDVIYGDIGIFYAAVYNLAFNVLIWTFGVHLMRRHEENGVKRSALERVKGLINPGLTAIIIGFTSFLFSIEIPEVIISTAAMIGRATTPMSMMFIGFMLSGLKLHHLFDDMRDYGVVFLRLIVIPGIMFLVLNALGAEGYVLGVPVLIAAMPAAANSGIFAARFNNNATLASKLIFISTLISAVTIPIFIQLLN